MNTDLIIKIVKYSIELEEIVAKKLSYHLNIKDWEKSKSFGISSESLSFNQKINLLIDIVGRDSVDKDIFIGFMVIRNKFVHLSLYKSIYELYTKNQQVKTAFKKINDNDITNEAEAISMYNELYKTLREQVNKLSDITMDGVVDMIKLDFYNSEYSKLHNKTSEIRKYIEENKEIFKEDLLLILDK